MRLYLSSFRLGNHIDDLQTLLPSGSKVLIVCNALDNMDHSIQKAIYQREESSLLSLGYETSQLDLQNYFNPSKELEKKLLNCDGLWVTGGNAFILNKAFHLSGLTSILKKLILNNQLVYAGYSAGIVVMGHTLKGIELVDDVHDHPRSYPPCHVLWEGLSIFNHAIVPHYRSQHSESAKIEKVIQLYQKHQIPYKALSDGDVIIIDD